MNDDGVRRGLTFSNAMSAMLVLVPVALILYWVHAGAMVVFLVSCVAIVPLAGLMGKATEHLAQQVGEGVGGLLNATFGNAAELIIALMALKSGMPEVVKASITGSIIGNILLVFGLAALVGGIRHESLTYNRTAAAMGSTLLVLASIALVVPALFHHVGGEAFAGREQALSVWIAAILITCYVLSLWFTLKTHRHLYVGSSDDREAVGTGGWSKRRSIGVLLASTVGVVAMSELLVHTIVEATETLGMSRIFVGVILVAVIGNAAEHSTAILMAAKNKGDLAINIAVGSSLQIALFVAPVLLFASYLFGQPMDLVFSQFEVAAIGLASLILGMICLDGESNWMEGVQLLAVYAILAIAFYYLPLPAG